MSLNTLVLSSKDILPTDHKKTSVSVPKEFFKKLDESLEQRNKSRASFEDAINIARGADIDDPVIADLVAHHYKGKVSQRTLFRWLEPLRPKPKIEHSTSRSKPVAEIADKKALDDSSIIEELDKEVPTTTIDNPILKSEADLALDEYEAHKKAEEERHAAETRKMRQLQGVAPSGEDLDTWPPFRIAVFDKTEVASGLIHEQIKKCKAERWKVVEVILRRIS